MTGCTTDELSRVGGAEELEIAARGSDASLRGPVPIWIVRVGDELYVRSWRGQNGGWFRIAGEGTQARTGGPRGRFVSPQREQRRGVVLAIILTGYLLVLPLGARGDDLLGRACTASRGFPSPRAPGHPGAEALTENRSAA